MILGVVSGTVISTQKDPDLVGGKLLLVRRVELEDMAATQDYVIAVDAVGAGAGEMVLVVAGSSARYAEPLRDKPVDAAIVGIVDQVEVGGRIVYSKPGVAASP
jgi:microcompartment protein CcmK/EutM